ncbi:hypothetical protein [Amycolatopsis jiangsuensis]|uniref:Uncharacterized protein n=1 Tax=Amycolatopsis jiangsuensis TaxID=1181879 RepID=A0A840IML3_9PSEU|nr:hypothetical protein [Amycolatopsis jiangsuensis]MBB4682617.1 hypothetical protein [Amycolatopsis jiangsuensis]
MLTIGLATGYLLREYRDALIHHPATRALADIVAMAVVALAHTACRALQRARRRLAAILDDELGRRPRAR